MVGGLANPRLILPVLMTATMLVAAPIAGTAAVAAPVPANAAVSYLGDRELLTSEGLELTLLVSGREGDEVTLAAADASTLRIIEETLTTHTLEMAQENVTIPGGHLAAGTYVLGEVVIDPDTSADAAHSLFPVVDDAGAVVELTLSPPDVGQLAADETPTSASQPVPAPVSPLLPIAEAPQDLADRLPPLARERFDADGDGVFAIPAPAAGSGGAGAIPAGLEAYYTQDLSLTAEACDALDVGEPASGMECGYLVVPIDRDDLSAGNLAIAVSRIPAAETPRGSLLWNPGGPGGSGLAYNQSGLDVPAVAAGFDLIGFDPRGVGASVPFAHCVSDEEYDANYAETIRGLSVAEIERRGAEDAEAFADACFANTGVLLGLDEDERANLVSHLGTWDSVGDMDILRSVLGDNELHYVGTSYGTQLGYAYAQRFPDSVGRLVLDAAVDPLPEQDDGAGFTADELSTIQQGAGFQNTFEQFALECSERGTQGLTWGEAYGTDEYADIANIGLRWGDLQDEPFSCPLGDGVTDVAALSATNAGFIAGFDAAGDGRGLTSDPRFHGERRLTSQLGREGVVLTMYNEQFWSYLAYALWETQTQQDGTAMLFLANSFTGRGADGRYDSSQAAFVSIRCTDSNSAGTPFDVDQARRFTEAYNAASPFQALGPASGTPDYCQFWQFAGTQPAGEQLTSVPNILVVSTSHDSATPYASGVSLARAVDGTLLSVAGASHGAFGNGLACVDDTVATYLLEGSLPPAGPLGEQLASPDTALMPDGTVRELSNRCEIDSFRPSGFSLSTPRATQGAEVGASILHFDARASYGVEFGGQQVARLTANNGGTASATFEVPDGFAPGDYVVRLIDASGAEVAQATLTVVGADVTGPQGIAAVPPAAMLPETGASPNWLLLGLVAMVSIGAGVIFRRSPRV